MCRAVLLLAAAITAALLVGYITAGLFPHGALIRPPPSSSSSSPSQFKSKQTSAPNLVVATAAEEETGCPLSKLTSSNLSLFLHPLDPKHRRQKQKQSLFYLLPTSSAPVQERVLSQQDLEHKTMFAFIHINKAGGTLFKTKVLHQAAMANKWNGAGFGSIFGWQRLAQGCSAESASKVYQPHAELEALTCGVPTELSPCGPVPVASRSTNKSCALRVIWGSRSLPLCALAPPGVPCVMSVVLRHPVERLISQYNYVCIEGSEGRKKWTQEWKDKGKCPLTLLEFLDRTDDLTSETFLLDHLTLSNNNHEQDGCASQVALRNLLHPCMRFLLLDRLADGVQRLARVWGPAMRPYLERLAQSGGGNASTPVLNAARYSPRIQAQMSNAQVLAQVQQRLKLDIEFYETAVQHYEEQWNAPLQSCTL